MFLDRHSQVFGDDQKIYGYKDLEIDVRHVSPFDLRQSPDRPPAQDSFRLVGALSQNLVL